MKADYIRNTTKMVVLKDLVTNKTRSFIMVFVGSYDYLTRSRNMGRNSYLYREPDYDGMVLYYAINGTFINGWRYSNGKLVGYISPSYNEQGESSAQTRGYYDCHYVEDSTSDNDNDDDDNWWNNPYPPGGAGNETNPVKPGSNNSPKAKKIFRNSNMTGRYNSIFGYNDSIRIEKEGVRLVAGFLNTPLKNDSAKGTKL